MFIETERLYSFPFSLPKKVGKETDVLLRLKGEPTVAVVGRVTIIFANKRNRTFYINWDASPVTEGKGFMTEGLQDLLPQLFGTGKVHRIVASIRPGNRRSRNLAQRLGFRYEGTAVSSLRLEDNIYADVQYWALTEEDMQARVEE